MTDKSSKKTIWENLSGAKKADAAEQKVTDETPKPEATPKPKKATKKNESAPISDQELLTHPTYKALQEQLTKTEEQLTQTKAQLSEAENEVTYKLAAIENVKRRCNQDMENTRKFSSEKIIRDLLPGIDNLERALESLTQGADTSSILKGVELTLQMFRKVLESHGVTTIAPVAGDTFDSHFHQAMSMQESNEQKPDSILTILQKGYALQGRLLRPAAVIVAKAPEENS